MTFEDAKVIGLGSLALLCLFLTVQLVMHRVDVWAIVRRYVAVHVNNYAYSDVDNMSSVGSDTLPSRSLSLETEPQTDRQTEQTAKIRAEELLTLFKLMRKAGIGREDAQAACKASGLPFNNNVWRDAAPPSKAVQPADENDDELITPYAGRRTRASYYPDQPELEYESP